MPDFEKLSEMLVEIRESLNFSKAKNKEGPVIFIDKFHILWFWPLRI